MKPFLLIISAPTGAGKTTIAKALADARPDSVAFSISATTRAPRAGEKNGVDYFFLTRTQFEERRTKGDFLEWAEYSGNLYGTLTSEVDRILSTERHVLLDIEVQGARTVRNVRKDVVSIFIVPPNIPTLMKRIEGRGSESGDAVATRLRTALEELQAGEEYDYVVINDERDKAISDVAMILDAETMAAWREANAIQLRLLRRELQIVVDKLNK